MITSWRDPTTERYFDGCTAWSRKVGHSSQLPQLDSRLVYSTILQTDRLALSCIGCSPYSHNRMPIRIDHARRPLTTAPNSQLPGTRNASIPRGPTIIPSVQKCPKSPAIQRPQVLPQPPIEYLAPNRHFNLIEGILHHVVRIQLINPPDDRIHIWLVWLSE